MTKTSREKYLVAKTLMGQGLKRRKAFETAGITEATFYREQRIERQAAEMQSTTKKED